MKRYESLNGVRTLACIGIVLMHIISNANYIINNDAANVISRFTHFVFLFMIISSFSMCCGYYDKIKNNKISVEDFYKRRISKILPFFAFLVLVDIIIEHNKISIVEGFADLSLLFGFIPKSLSVIGVGWFIGLVFIFYLIFPFFVYLFSNKKRAWFTTIVSLLMNLSCIYYFNIGRTNMFYSFLFFCIGGLLFLYKENIIKVIKKGRIVNLILLLLSFIIFSINFHNKYILIIQVILFSVLFVTYSISFDKSSLNNKFTKFIGSISMEIYLSHMVIYRILEKINLLHIIENDYIQYIISFLLIVIGTIILAKLFDFFWNKIEKRLLQNENTIS